MPFLPASDAPKLERSVFLEHRGRTGVRSKRIVYRIERSGNFPTEHRPDFVTRTVPDVLTVCGPNAVGAARREDPPFASTGLETILVWNPFWKNK